MFLPFQILEKQPNLQLPLNVQKSKVLQRLALDPARGSAPRPLL